MRSYLRQKMRWLPRLGVERHALILPSHRDQVRTWGTTRVYELASPGMPGRPGYRVLLRADRILKILCAEDPDMIELGSPYLLPLVIPPIARALDARVVAFFHADYPNAYFRPWGAQLQAATGFPLAGWVGGGAEAYLRATHRALDGTCVASRGNVARLKAAGVPRLYHTPLGTDTSHFNPNREDPGLRARLSIPAHHPWCLCVGRLSMEKGVRELTAALPQAWATRNLHLVLVGDGPLRRELVDRYQDEPWFHWVPRLDDQDQLAALYASADFFVAPGPKESFALATVEALASGRPVVGADTGGVAELLAGEQAGMLCDPGDSRGFAATLIRMVDAPGEQLGLAARELGLRYSWQTSFQRLLDAYTDVLQRKPRRARHPIAVPASVDDLSPDPDTPAARDLAWALGAS